MTTSWALPNVNVTLSPATMASASYPTPSRYRYVQEALAPPTLCTVAGGAFAPGSGTSKVFQEHAPDWQSPSSQQSLF